MQRGSSAKGKAADKFVQNMSAQRVVGEASRNKEKKNVNFGISEDKQCPESRKAGRNSRPVQWVYFLRKAKREGPKKITATEVKYFDAKFHAEELLIQSRPQR